MSDDTQAAPVDFTPVGLERDVRLDITLALLKRNTITRNVEREAEALTRYVMDGPKVDPGIVKKLTVWLPGQNPFDSSAFREEEAKAYLKDDGTIEIEFKDMDVRDMFLGMLNDDIELIDLSFNYRPAHPVDTTKDN